MMLEKAAQQPATCRRNLNLHGHQCQRLHTHRLSNGATTSGTLDELNAGIGMNFQQNPLLLLLWWSGKEG